MKVLHIFNELRPSGAETMWVAASSVVCREGVKFHVLETSQAVGPYSGQMLEAGYSVLRIPHASRRLMDPFYCWRLLKLIRKERYDAVQIHPEAWRLTNCLLARIGGAKRITTTIHSIFDVRGWRAAKRRFSWKFLRRLGVIPVAISEAVRKNEARYCCNSTLIWNWIDEKRLKREHAFRRTDVGFGEDDVLLLILGNCSPVKNHLFLLDVLRSLPEKYKLLHVGEEDTGRTEKNYAVKAGIQDRVRFLGARTDVGAILRGVDLFVMSSTHEGLGLSCIEALYEGVPSVVANKGGLLDLARLIPGCFAVELDIGSFSAKIRTVSEMSCSERIGLMNLAKREVVRRFDLERNVMQYVNLWSR